MRALRVVIIGGGPAGLFLGRLLKLADPSTSVRVYERHGPDDAFGFGVVFSARTMSAFQASDPQTCELIRRESVSWRDMELRLPTATLRYGGYGFTGISRRSLLRVLREQAAALGVELLFHRPVTVADFPPPAAGGPDVIAVADGVHSVNRRAAAERFRTTVRPGSARYIWLGTRASFDAVTFPFVVTEHGAFAAHAYPYGGGMSTFIVETDEGTWRAAGMAESTTAARHAGQTDDYSRQFLTSVFAQHLGGEPLLGNNSRWDTFRVVRNQRWSDGNAVLLGDAAHTAHFSVGSGTKLAMEDAIALAAALREARTSAEAFATYAAVRRQPVWNTQHWAERSMHWWETYHRRLQLPPNRFGLHFLTRTGAIDYPGLRRRHPAGIDAAETEFARLAQRPAGAPGHAPGASASAGASGRSAPTSDQGALCLPLHLGPIRLANRVVGRLTGQGSQRQAAVSAVAGCGLVLADWRGADGQAVDGRGADWQAVVKDIADWGGVFGVMVDPEQVDQGLHRLVRDAGAGLVEIEAGALASPPRWAETVEALPGVLVCAAVVCPRESPWSPRAEEVLRRCHGLRRTRIALAHVRVASGGSWQHAVDWADRIRTETGLPVLLDGPPGWAGRAHGEVCERAGTPVHTAVVSGRVDLVCEPDR